MQRRRPRPSRQSAPGARWGRPQRRPRPRRARGARRRAAGGAGRRARRPRQRRGRPAGRRRPAARAAAAAGRRPAGCRPAPARSTPCAARGSAWQRRPPARRRLRALDLALGQRPSCLPPLLRDAVAKISAPLRIQEHGQAAPGPPRAMAWVWRGPHPRRAAARPWAHRPHRQTRPAAACSARAAPAPPRSRAPPGRRRRARPRAPRGRPAARHWRRRWASAAPAASRRCPHTGCRR